MDQEGISFWRLGFPPSSLSEGRFAWLSTLGEGAREFSRIRGDLRFSTALASPGNRRFPEDDDESKKGDLLGIPSLNAIGGAMIGGGGEVAEAETGGVWTMAMVA